MDVEKDDHDDEDDSGIPAEDSIVVDEEDALRTIEKLRGDDLPSRVEAARKLSVVAAALGPRRTREELLPFLSDGVDDDDSVLEVIASSLGDLVPYVGGRKHAKSLLHPLELLLAVEESVVRERAMESAIAVGERMDDEDYRAEFVGMISRLATKEWFTARISACDLIPLAFPRMSSDDDGGGGGGGGGGCSGMRAAHVAHFADLCRDDAPMVRRIASRNLGPMLRAVVDAMGPSSLDEGGVVSATLLDLYDSLAGGDQPDSVRLHTTQNCVHLGEALALVKERALSSLSSSSSAAAAAGPGGGESTLARINSIVGRVLPLIVATIDDRSWRVRWTAASKFASVVHAYSGLDDSMDALVPAYEKLLQDPEAEVRTAATLNFSEVAKTGAMVYPAGWTGGGGGGGVGSSSHVVGVDEPADPSRGRIPVALRLVRRVVQLTEDDSENVRAALAMVATDLAPVLGRDATITHLLPPMLLLLRDSTSEVRLNIVSSLSMLNDVIGAELLAQSLLPAILDLADDGKWRIRLAVIERIPLLARQLGKEFFTDRLLSLCVGWLGDDIASIREAAAADLRELTALLGSEWAVQNLLPRVRQVMEHPSYLRRMNAVRALSLMATAMDAFTAQWEILPMLLEMHCDPVPNVRFNVAKGLGMVGPLFQSSYEGQIVPILTLMMEDPDRDVRYFATQASDSLRASFDKPNKN
jgi:serine/threonine-protein phosphatase 2A regulatory subunit A